MKSNSRPYHLEIQQHRKNPCGVLRTSYREGGKVRHENIARLPGLTLDQLKLMQAALQNKVVHLDELDITLSREFGASFACHSIAKNLGLHKAIHSKPEQDWVRSALAMIIGRIVYAGSKLSLSNCGTFSALWETCGISSEVDVNLNCYSAMDKLFTRQNAIQKALARKHLTDGMLVLYDITSSYMEGEYADSDIVAFGYNRDKKRGHEQIVISLLCSGDGCPVAVEVLCGNTQDGTTVIDKISEIKEKYGLEKIVFVGDRGMITQANFEKIDHETVKVISALNHGAIQQLLDKGTIQLSLFDEMNIVEVVDGDIRYCLCKNPVMAEKETTTRLTLIKKTTDELDKILASKRKTKNSKAVRAGKVLGKYKMGKFITISGDDDCFSYMVDELKIKKEALLDGCYIVYTDVSAQDMKTADVVKAYKDLVKVEQAFRHMKSVTLELRPVFHRTDERIKCHVFICMLAYYILWHMKQKLSPLFDVSRPGRKRKFSFEYVIETLKALRKETINFMDVETFKISTPTDEQKAILELLEVKL